MMPHWSAPPKLAISSFKYNSSWNFFNFTSKCIIFIITPSNCCEHFLINLFLNVKSLLKESYYRHDLKFSTHYYYLNFVWDTCNIYNEHNTIKYLLKILNDKYFLKIIFFFASENKMFLTYRRGSGKRT
jgi:hypothetical protein